MQAFARPRSAFSSAAQDVADRIAIVINVTETSEVLFGRKSQALAKLMVIANDCVLADWDGNEANPVNEVAVKNAEAFVRALPDDMPMPELAPEPDGSISLDWITSRYRQFSLSVGSDNRLACAWLDGADKGHAVACFDGVTIPGIVKSGLQSVIGITDNVIRVA